MPDENGSGVGLVNNVLVLIKREEVLERGSSLKQGVTATGILGDTRIRLVANNHTHGDNIFSP
jgi:hypothetical protein